MSRGALDAAVERALSALLPGRGAEGEAVAEARRVVFRAVGLAVAEARGRLGAEAASQLPWHLGSPPAEAQERLREARAILDQEEGVASELRSLRPAELVTAYERSLSWSPPDVSTGRRQGRGAFYTPSTVVEGLLDDALDPAVAEAAAEGRLPELRICDPACGAGAFLLAAHRRLTAALATASGRSVAEASAHVARTCLHGVDVDRPAVELARFLIWLQTELPPAELAGLQGLRVGDSLLGAPLLGSRAEVGPWPGEDAWCEERAPLLSGRFFHWHLQFPEVFPADARPGRSDSGGFDVVVGNPPFLGQLRASSAHGPQVRALLEARFQGQVRGYADAAAAFLLLSLEILRPGGRSCLVLPVSFLAARDAGKARSSAARQAGLAALWMATGRVFQEASVFVVAPTLVRGGPRRGVTRRRVDATFEDRPSIATDMELLSARPTWSPLVADLAGVPPVVLPEARGTVSTIAAVTADFRDQFYGLRGFVLEDADLPPAADRSAFPPLVTTGLVEPAECRWGRTPTRFDGRRWEAPRVDLERLEREGALGPWARACLVPKILVATQTRALEAVVDEHGSWLPSVPLVSVVPRHPRDLWRLAAALGSPPLTAHAAGTWLGTGMSLRAIKLSADQIRGLPLPTDDRAWTLGAEAFRRAQAGGADRAEQLARFGERMCEAYGVEAGPAAELMSWWSAAVAR